MDVHADHETRYPSLDTVKQADIAGNMRKTN